MIFAPDLPNFKVPSGYIFWNGVWFIGIYIYIFGISLRAYQKTVRSDEMIFLLSILIFIPIMAGYNIFLLTRSFPVWLAFLNSKKFTLIFSLIIFALVFLSSELSHGCILTIFKKKRYGKRV